MKCSNSYVLFELFRTLNSLLKHSTTNSSLLTTTLVENEIVIEQIIFIVSNTLNQELYESVSLFLVMIVWNEQLSEVLFNMNLVYCIMDILEQRANQLTYGGLSNSLRIIEHYTSSDLLDSNRESISKRLLSILEVVDEDFDALLSVFICLANLHSNLPMPIWTEHLLHTINRCIKYETDSDLLKSAWKLLESILFDIIMNNSQRGIGVIHEHKDIYIEKLKHHEMILTENDMKSIMDCINKLDSI